MVRGRADADIHRYRLALAKKIRSLLRAHHDQNYCNALCNTSRTGHMPLHEPTAGIAQRQPLTRPVVRLFSDRRYVYYLKTSLSSGPDGVHQVEPGGHHHGTLKPRLHDTTGFDNRLYNRFDNRLYRVNKHPTGCQTSCQTGLTTGLTTDLTTGCIV